MPSAAVGGSFSGISGYGCIIAKRPAAAARVLAEVWLYTAAVDRRTADETHVTVELNDNIIPLSIIPPLR